MKKIINKIIEILDYDVYRFTLEPFVVFFSSYMKTKIAIIIWVLSFNFFVNIGANFFGGASEIKFSSYDYNENSNVITVNQLAQKILKIKYYHQESSLEECKVEYEKTLKNVENIYKHLNIKGHECNKTNNTYYSYEIIAEANYFYKVIYKVGSLLKSMPYYFGGVAIIIVSPLMYLANN